MSLPNLAQLALPLGSVTGSPLDHLDHDTIANILEQVLNDPEEVCKVLKQLCGGNVWRAVNSPECQGIYERVARHYQMPDPPPGWTRKEQVIWVCSINAGSPDASILTRLLQNPNGMITIYLLETFARTNFATDTPDGKKLVKFGNDVVFVYMTFKLNITREAYFMKQSSFEFELADKSVRRMNVVYGIKGRTPDGIKWEYVPTHINAIDDLSEDGRVVRRTYDLSRYNRENDPLVYPETAFVCYKDGTSYNGLKWDEDNIHLKIIYEDGRVEFYEASTYTNRRAHPTYWSPVYILKGVTWPDGAALQGDNLLFNKSYNQFLAITLGSEPGRYRRTS